MKAFSMKILPSSLYSRIKIENPCSVMIDKNHTMRLSLLPITGGKFVVYGEDMGSDRTNMNLFLCWSYDSGEILN